MVRAPTPPTDPPARRGLRPEIQALRALAVVLVVAFHVAPDAIPGGYVGVDVFFVISGYLITAGLVRELQRTGTVGLFGFWARRARRLLPAAFLVIAACVAGVLLLVPLTAWGPMLDELRASALYIENRQLAASAVDYFAEGEAASPVRHFWSLSVEEQFYIVWPVLLLGVAALTRRGTAAARRRAVVATIASLTVASFAWAVVQVASEPALAYFGTSTRAWEFGVGALLAATPVALRLPTAARTALAWAGLVAIVVAAMAYTEATPFPGVAALLPVLGAVAVIGAGLPGGAASPSRVMQLHGVQRVGDLSYGIYLWHWPLLILGPYALGGPLGPFELTAAVVATYGLAWATARWVEDPIRHGALTRRPARVTLGAAAAGMAATVLLVAVGEVRLERDVAAAQARTASTLDRFPKCFGAASRDPDEPCTNPALVRTVVPEPVIAKRGRNAPCKVVERLPRLSVCAFGRPEGKGGTVALLGDSHAAHWRGAVDEVAKSEGWRGVSMTYTGCPLSAGEPRTSPSARVRCLAFRRQTYAWLGRHPEVHTVFVAALSGGTGVATRPGQDRFEAQVDGYVEAWKKLPASVRRIVVLRDNPKAGRATAACVQTALQAEEPAGEACATPRKGVLDVDPSVEAARRAGSPRVQVVDLTDRFCDARRCFPVVGGALVHRDLHHLTPEYVQTLGPPLRRALDRLRFSVDPKA